MGDTSIKFEVVPGKNQKSEYVMACGKHTVRGWCKALPPLWKVLWGRSLHICSMVCPEHQLRPWPPVALSLVYFPEAEPVPYLAIHFG